MEDREFIRPFGEVAMGKGYITVDQLVHALNAQVTNFADKGEHKLIGTILYEQGSISTDQFNEVRELCCFTRMNAIPKVIRR